MTALRSFAGHAPRLGQRVFIDPSSVVTGQVVLGDDVSIWPHVSIRGDLLEINIGARTNIQDNCILHTTHPSSYHPGGAALSIAEDVTVGHGVILHGCQVQSLSLIGMGSIILDGAVVESEVILGAGSLVPQGKRLETGYLYFGNPVKKIRALDASEKEFLRYSAQKYVELKNLHLQQQ